MTPEEAIKDLKYDNERCLRICEGACLNIEKNQCNCRDGVIERMLDELLQYREIGTVEECRGAVEKQKPKLNYKPRFLGKATYTCPKCGNCCLEEFANERQNNNYCWDCGQAIQWDENLEGMEDD